MDTTGGLRTRAVAVAATGAVVIPLAGCGGSDANRQKLISIEQQKQHYTEQQAACVVDAFNRLGVSEQRQLNLWRHDFNNLTSGGFGDLIAKGVEVAAECHISLK